MKIKPLTGLRRLMVALGGTKTCKSLVNVLNLGKREDGVGLILAPINMIPVLGKLAETAGILPEGKTAAVLAGACAAYAAMEDHASDEVVALNSDDMT